MGNTPRKVSGQGAPRWASGSAPNHERSPAPHLHSLRHSCTSSDHRTRDRTATRLLHMRWDPMTVTRADEMHKHLWDRLCLSRSPTSRPDLVPTPPRFLTFPLPSFHPTPFPQDDRTTLPQRCCSSEQPRPRLTFQFLTTLDVPGRKLGSFVSRRHVLLVTFDAWGSRAEIHPARCQTYTPCSVAVAIAVAIAVDAFRCRLYTGTVVPGL